MDILRLDEYYKLNIPIPFLNSQWEKYIEIVGPEKMIELYKLMKGKKHACSTPYHYLVKELNYKLYYIKKRPFHSNEFFDFPVSTAEGQFEVYGHLYPRP
jgi:hypothetical protein